MPPETRRQLILLEAGKLFGAHGYAGTRIEDVASAAGVTKPMVYRHFESKHALYLALLEKHEADLPTFLEGPQLASPHDVHAILDGWLDYASVNAHTWLMLFRDHSGGAEIEAARARVSVRAHAVLAGVVAERTPSARRESIAPTAAILTSGLAGLILWWIDNPSVPKDVVLESASSATRAVLGE